MSWCGFPPAGTARSTARHAANYSSYYRANSKARRAMALPFALTAGDAVLMEDTTGKGHSATVKAEDDVYGLMVHLE